MVDKENVEKLLNIIIKRKYPFIEHVEVYRLKKFNTYNLDININLHISRKNMISMVDSDCINDGDDSIFMSLYSFEQCSNGKIKRHDFEEYLLIIYKSISDDTNILIYVPNISVISPDINGEF